MTKANIIELISEKTGFTKSEVKLIFEEFLQRIENCLVEGNTLEIRGFGTFKVRSQNARKARNPKTGKEVMVPARKKVALKVSREWNELLND